MQMLLLMCTALLCLKLLWMLLFVSSCCKFGVLAVSAVAVENVAANADVYVQWYSGCCSL